MESRKDKEREFHNKTFSDNTREKASKFYEITQSSRAYYRNFLQANCKSAKVLEYGCGPGSFSFFLSKAGAEVFGIDISDVAIHQAKQRARQEKLNNIVFNVMDAESLDFKDETFDLICGTGILHHLNLDKAYSELARVLKPEGKAIFLEPLGHNPFINVYRKLTPNLRTADEHPLLMRDVKLGEKLFGKIDPKYFHLLSIMSVPFRKVPGFRFLLNVLDALDSSLFALFPFARKYAWTIVFVLSQPSKSLAD